MPNGLQRLPGGSLRFQQLIAEIDMAIRSSARFYDDADIVLIEQLNQIIEAAALRCDDRDAAAADATNAAANPPRPTIQLKAYNEK